MLTFAVLGATRSVAQALLTILLESPDNKIQAYCRSNEGFTKLSPTIASSTQVQVFEGSLQNTSLLANCLLGTHAAFLAVAEVSNKPGYSIALQTAHAVVSALSLLKKQNPTAHLPKPIVLSSASLDYNLMSSTPKLILNILYRANSYIYSDLREAETYLRSSHDLVPSVTFVRPAALSHDKRRGHYVSTRKAEMPLLFLDLAAGMVDIAGDEEGRWSMKLVAICPRAKDVQFPWEAVWLLLKGLLFTFFRGRIGFWGDLLALGLCVFFN
ncbi:hypothetical protein IFR05_004465 [Cadophora sp. M221]|nr:hypothetical protein IFR05_004465 [Cadophora sp. M221]